MTGVAICVLGMPNRIMVAAIGSFWTADCGDTGCIELSYEDIAEYFPGLEFSPQQRVAFVAELFDASERPRRRRELSRGVAPTPSS